MVNVGEALGSSLAEIARGDADREIVCSVERGQVVTRERELARLRLELLAATNPVERSRIQREIGRGEEALERERDELATCLATAPMFSTLARHYRTAFDGLSTEIATLEGVVRTRANTGLFGVDLWGGAEQLPLSTFFSGPDFAEIGRCDGRAFETGESTLPTSVVPFDHSQLEPFMIASNLRGSEIPGVRDGLERLSACVAASWRHVSSEPSGLGGRIQMTFHLSIAVNIRYGDKVVFRHTFQTEHAHRALVAPAQVPTFDPVNDPQQGRDPHPLLTGQTEVAERIEQAGEPVQIAARRLDGSKLLSNEVLRSPLFGSDGILGGTDADREDSVLDDVRDLYAFFSARPEDPLPANVLGELEILAEDRLQRLVALLTEIMDVIEATGRPEPPEVFAPTLLRLSMV